MHKILWSLVPETCPHCGRRASDCPIAERAKAERERILAAIAELEELTPSPVDPRAEVR